MSNPSDECGKQVGGCLHSRAVNFLSTAPVTPCKSTTKRWLSNCECNHRFDHGGGVFERSEIWYVHVERCAKTSGTFPRRCPLQDTLTHLTVLTGGASALFCLKYSQLVSNLCKWPLEFRHVKLGLVLVQLMPGVNLLVRISWKLIIFPLLLLFHQAGVRTQGSTGANWRICYNRVTGCPSRPTWTTNCKPTTLRTAADLGVQ